MPSVTIRVETEKPSTGQNIGLFFPFSDSLKLTVFYTLSADLASMNNLWLQISYQVVDFRHNQVIFYQKATLQYIPGGGPSGLSWITLVPSNSGFQWTDGDIFGFRGAIEMYEQTANGQVAIDATAVSEIGWFRLIDAAEV